MIQDLAHLSNSLLTVVDILSDGQHLSEEKRTQAFDVLKLKMFIEALDQGELK